MAKGLRFVNLEPCQPVGAAEVEGPREDFCSLVATAGEWGSFQVNLELAVRLARPSGIDRSLCHCITCQECSHTSTQRTNQACARQIQRARNFMSCDLSSTLCITCNSPKPGR
eukprot:3446063-Amphidinium_carterae.1